MNREGGEEWLGAYSEVGERFLLVDLFLGAGNGFLDEELQRQVKGVVLHNDVLVARGEVAGEGHGAGQLNGAPLQAGAERGMDAILAGVRELTGLMRTGG